jgi:hypothetical protein
MAVARIAAIALSVLSLTLVAQTERKIPINVTVTDQAGARIPNAMVQVRPDAAKPTIEIRANAQGIAVLSLAAGTYTISVLAPGFQSWRTTVQLASNSNQSINAELRVGGVGSGPVINDDSIIQTERQTLDVSIPFEPVEPLIDLPGHKLRRFKWPHHSQS